MSSSGTATTPGVPWTQGTAPGHGSAGLDHPAGTGASVGRSSPASQPLEAQGPCEAVAGMKHSEECHLLTPAWKFLELPKFPPGLRLQGLERALPKAQWWESGQEEKGPAIPCFGSRARLLISLPSSRRNTWHSTGSEPALRRNILSLCGTVLEGPCGVFQLSSFLPRSHISRTFQGPVFFQPILESDRFVHSGDCGHED